MDFENKIIIIPDKKYFSNDKKENAQIGQININNYYKFNKTLKLNDIKDEISMIIPELVLYELIANNMKSLNIDSDEYLNELKAKYLNNDANIIKIDPNKENLFKTILKRTLNKTPPFTKDSDNGFKDTILFLSVLEFCKNNTFKKCILVSGDNIVNKKQDLKEEFSNYCKKDSELLDMMFKKDFNRWLDDKYELFTALEEYLDNEFYPQLMEKYSSAYDISWGNGDTIVESYQINKENTEMYQVDINKYEVVIYLSIGINRSLDAAIGDFYRKDDEYYITQSETYIIEQKKKWWSKLVNARYNVFFDEPDYDDLNEYKKRFRKNG